MQKLTYSIDIAAPRDRVWSALFDDASYRDWTSAFAAGSHYIGSWETGGELRFLDGSGKAGMFSRVVENRPGEYMLLEHVGLVQDGEIDTESEEARKWAPAHESYRLTESNGGTRLEIEMDATEEMREYFDTTWPQALARLKETAESGQVV